MNHTILIVDDSLTVRMDLVEAFQLAGFQTRPCASLAAAREALTTGPVSLIMLDVNLPDGDGVSFLKEVRNMPSFASTPILMLSSEVEVKDRIRGIKTGADDYVGKPYDRGYVVTRAQELLHRGESTHDSAPTTILLVDDSTTFREELREALEKAGYSVVTAASGEEGLRLAAEQRPSAIIVDGVMPGMDGATFIRRIQLDAALRGTSCVMMTASEERSAELQALDAGADGFMHKDDRFDVILARVAAVVRRTDTSAVPSVRSLLGPKRVLAVDDSPTYLQAIADVMRVEGYDVVLARSGGEALEMLAVQPVDCILLDLRMPGLSGEETCRRIKTSPAVRDIPVIIIAAVEDGATLIDCLAAGADDFISKSSDFEVLRARMRAQIRRKQFEDENRRIRDELLQRELIAAEARAARDLAEAKAAHVEELETKNKELEAFSYSVAHDLRAPLRSIDGFSRILLERNADKLDDSGRRHLQHVVNSAVRMSSIIDDLLTLSRISLAQLNLEPVDLTALTKQVMTDLAGRDPERKVDVRIEDGLVASADPRLVKVMMENLLGNAWKFTSKQPQPRIEVGQEETEAGRAFYIRDNGAGFDMQYSQRLFAPFQRLHNESEFPGTGVGLATVNRVVTRHGGHIWVHAERGLGATFFFTLARSV